MRGTVVQVQRTHSRLPVPPERQTKSDFGAVFPGYSQSSRQGQVPGRVHLFPMGRLSCVEKPVEVFC